MGDANLIAVITCSNLHWYLFQKWYRFWDSNLYKIRR